MLQESKRIYQFDAHDQDCANIVDELEEEITIVKELLDNRNSPKKLSPAKRNAADPRL